MDDHFDTSSVFEISKFDISKLACISRINLHCFIISQKAGVKLKNLLNRSGVKKALDKNYDLKYVSKNSGKVFTWENVFKVGLHVMI